MLIFRGLLSSESGTSVKVSVKWKIIQFEIQAFSLSNVLQSLTLTFILNSGPYLLGIENMISCSTSLISVEVISYWNKRQHFYQILHDWIIFLSAIFW